MSSKRLVPTFVAASLLLAAGSVAEGVSSAEHAILIPGAMPFKQINPLYPMVAKTYPDIGKHFHADGPGRLIEYSQNPLAANRSLGEGVDQTIDAIEQTDGPVVVIGESMGAMVAWRVAEELAKSDPNHEKDISFVLIAPPDVGVSEYFPEGTYIPILNYRISRIKESGYPTTIVVGEYDGWSDPPDRPWNLISSANALAGIAYVHGPPSFTADVSGLTPTRDGTVTSYLVPTENLPLTQVFRDVGVPDALVDNADRVLRPIVDAGYVRHDQPGDTRPYLYDGAIHRNVQSQQQARVLPGNDGDEKPDDGAQRRNRPDELRQAVRTLRDRVETGFDQLTKRIADRRASQRAGAEAVTP